MRAGVEGGGERPWARNGGMGTAVTTCGRLEQVMGHAVGFGGKWGIGGDGASGAKQGTDRDHVGVTDR